MPTIAVAFAPSTLQKAVYKPEESFFFENLIKNRFEENERIFASLSEDTKLETLETWTINSEVKDSEATYKDTIDQGTTYPEAETTETPIPGDSGISSSTSGSTSGTADLGTTNPEAGDTGSEGQVRSGSGTPCTSDDDCQFSPTQLEFCGSSVPTNSCSESFPCTTLEGNLSNESITEPFFDLAVSTLIRCPVRVVVQTKRLFSAISSTDSLTASQITNFKNIADAIRTHAQDMQTKINTAISNLTGLQSSTTVDPHIKNNLIPLALNKLNAIKDILEAIKLYRDNHLNNLLDDWNEINGSVTLFTNAINTFKAQWESAINNECVSISELNLLIAQKDNLITQINTLNTKIQGYKTTLTTLQTALESFAEPFSGSISGSNSTSENARTKIIELANGIAYLKDFKLQPTSNLLTDLLSQLNIEMPVTVPLSITDIFIEWGVPASSAMTLASMAITNHGECTVRTIAARTTVLDVLPANFRQRKNVTFFPHTATLDKVQLANYLANPSTNWATVPIQYRTLLTPVESTIDHNRSLYVQRLQEVQDDLKSRINLDQEFIKALGNLTQSGVPTWANIDALLTNSEYWLPTLVTATAGPLVVSICQSLGILPPPKPLPTDIFNKQVDQRIELVINNIKKIKDLKDEMDQLVKDIILLRLSITALEATKKRFAGDLDEHDEMVFNIWWKKFGLEIETVSPVFYSIFQSAYNRKNTKGQVTLPQQKLYAKDVLGAITEQKNTTAPDPGGTFYIDQEAIVWLVNQHPSVRFLEEKAYKFVSLSQKLDTLLIAGLKGTKTQTFVDLAGALSTELDTLLNQINSSSHKTNAQGIKTLLSGNFPQQYVDGHEYISPLEQIQTRVKELDDFLKMVNDPDVVGVISMLQGLEADTWENWFKTKFPRLLVAIAVGTAAFIGCTFFFTGVGALVCGAAVSTLVGLVASELVASAQYNFFGVGTGSLIDQFINGAYVIGANGRPVQLDFGTVLESYVSDFFIGFAITFATMGLAKVVVGFCKSLTPIFNGAGTLSQNARTSMASFLTRLRNDFGSRLAGATAGQRAIIKSFFYEYFEELTQEFGTETAVAEIIAALNIKLGGLELILPGLFSSVGESVHLRRSNGTFFFSPNERNQITTGLSNNNFTVTLNAVTGGFTAERVVSFTENNVPQEITYTLTFAPELLENDFSQIANTPAYQQLLDLTRGDLTINETASLPVEVNALTTVTQTPDGRNIKIELSPDVVENLNSEDEELRTWAMKVVNEELIHGTDTVISPATCQNKDLYIARRAFQEIAAKARAAELAGDRDTQELFHEVLTKMNDHISNNQYTQATNLAKQYGLTNDDMLLFDQDYTDNTEETNVEEEIIIQRNYSDSVPVLKFKNHIEEVDIILGKTITLKLKKTGTNQITLTGPGINQVLNFGDSVNIGRSSENDIVISDLKVSRKHLLIEISSTGRVSVIDLGSKHGTIVNLVQFPASVLTFFQTGTNLILNEDYEGAVLHFENEQAQTILNELGYSLVLGRSFGYASGSLTESQIDNLIGQIASNSWHKPEAKEVELAQYYLAAAVVITPELKAKLFKEIALIHLEEYLHVLNSQYGGNVSNLGKSLPSLITDHELDAAAWMVERDIDLKDTLWIERYGRQDAVGIINEDSKMDLKGQQQEFDISSGKKVIVRVSEKNYLLIQSDGSGQISVSYKGYTHGGGEITIGRNTSNDIVINDPVISNQHLKIQAVENDRVLIIDTSTNGSVVWGEQ